ncbi:addiction module antitoxin RelB [Spirochaetia bacterium]|nr:addiction module antitoxin RelB [Spirochaetia bacterium]
MTIRKTVIFEKWLRKLRDRSARGLILTRIDRLEEGNPGDHRFLGDISELRIDHGPGYRVYYKDTGKEIIILLCGGDKSTQQADVEKARKIALLPLEEEHEEEKNGKNNCE